MAAFDTVFLTYRHTTAGKISGLGSVPQSRFRGVRGRSGTMPEIHDFNPLAIAVQPRQCISVEL